MCIRTLSTRRSLARRGTGLLFSIATLPLAATLASTSAAAQLTVYDPSNFSQNVLTAARTLQQVNNQIRSLQNQATMLINQAKNLVTVGFPELQAITQTLREIDQLMGQAQSIQFQVASTERQFRQLFPSTFDPALTLDAQVVAARARMEASTAAYRQTMSVQSQIVENVAADTQTLNGIVARSQGAEGALAVGQATNQLLALAAKQQFQLQTMLAAQYRADALEQARRNQAESDARAAARKFLGSGSIYTPQPPVR